MIYIKKINESKLRLENLEYDAAIGISKYFSFYVESSKWNPKVKCGIWDGYIRLFDIKRSILPYGLLKSLLQYLKVNGIEYELDKAIIKIDFSYVTDDYLNDLVKKYKCQHQLRDYQIPAIKTLLQENKGIVVLPTGSGKSFCLYMYCQTILEKFKDWKILLIVPTIGLVEQMEYDFHDYDRNNDTEFDLKQKTHKIYSGKEKHNEKPITISTWQSLQNIEEVEFFKQFQVVIVDECFHPDAEVLTVMGYKKIKYINENDMIINYDEKKKIFKEDRVIKKHKNISSEKMYELEFDNNKKVKVTGNHKFLTSNRGWVRADQLNEIDIIVQIDK